MNKKKSGEKSSETKKENKKREEKTEKERKKNERNERIAGKIKTEIERVDMSTNRRRISMKIVIVYSTMI